jgi:hypothetical protein
MVWRVRLYSSYLAHIGLQLGSWKLELEAMIENRLNVA